MGGNLPPIEALYLAEQISPPLGLIFQSRWKSPMGGESPPPSLFIIGFRLIVIFSKSLFVLRYNTGLIILPASVKINISLFSISKDTDVLIFMILLSFNNLRYLYKNGPSVKNPVRRPFINIFVESKFHTFKCVRLLSCASTFF